MKSGKPPGTPWATPGLLGAIFNFTLHKGDTKDDDDDDNNNNNNNNNNNCTRYKKCI
jgi:hypothetical protein